MISVDTLAQNTAFAKKENADFPLIADPTKETAHKYGVLMSFLGEQVARRWTFYIDPTGKIVDIDHMVKPATSGQDIIARLTALHVPKAK
jgi:peroxiredoxin Q/BCP